MAKIFLCHANEDKPQVRDVYQRLKAEGFEPWLDKEDLLPGQLWDQEIRRALKNSDIILIFFSQKSVVKRGYVQDEMKLALEVREEIPEVYTIPVRLDNCEIPEPFRIFQWVDLFDERGFERIIRAIRTKLAQGDQESQRTNPKYDDIPAPLSLYFNLDEFSSTEIAEIIGFLSELYRELGGDGLIIDEIKMLEPSFIVEPVGV